MELDIIYHREDLDQGFDLIVFRKDEDMLGSGMNKREFQRYVILEFVRKFTGINDAQIRHDNLGAPYVEGNPDLKISISHSNGYYAVILSKNKCGVDIEMKGKNLLRGRNYFLSDEEIKTFPSSQNDLLVMWSAKECGYKYFGGKADSYKEGIKILSISENRVEVEVNSERILCEFLETDEFILVYSV